MEKDPIAAFRPLLTRSYTIEEALDPYLGANPYETDKDADADETSEGLRRDRLKALVLLLSLRTVAPSCARMAAALLWRAVPVAKNPEQIAGAMRTLCEWRSNLDVLDIERIIHAHTRYETMLNEVVRRTGSVEGPEIEDLLDDLAQETMDDTVMIEMGEYLVIVHMDATDYFVGIQDDDVTIIIDRIPHDRGRGWGPDAEPTDPRPTLLLDA